MIRRRDFALAGLSAAALAAVHGTAVAVEQRNDANSHDAMFEKCARACSDCQRACDGCATYCARALAKGSTHHFETLMSCTDCADLCATAAQIVSRSGMAVDLACRACAEACSRCAGLCARDGADDPTMTRCADECRKCEAACRDMLSHAASDRKP